MAGVGSLFWILLKNALLVLALFSALVWIYCVLRIFDGNFPWSDLFIDGIPITFLQLAMLSFVISGCSTFLYLLMREAEKL